MIDSRDISVVVQGPIKENVSKGVLLSVRRVLPEAELILSTWKGSDVSELEYDRVIFNHDPGIDNTFLKDQSYTNNVNRQIVSTYAGIKASKRKYTVKLRTDFEMISNDFLNVFEKYNIIQSRYSFFSHPIICCELFSRNPRVVTSPYAVFFHPSDIFFFGMRDDLEKLYDIPLYCCKETVCMHLLDVGASCLFPEQYIWTSYLKQKAPELLDILDRQLLYKINEELIVKNFIVLSNKQIGIIPQKKEIYVKTPIRNCYTHIDWLLIRFRYIRKYRFLYYLYILKVGMLIAYYFFDKYRMRHHCIG